MDANYNLRAACCLIKLLLLATVHDDLGEFLILLVKNCWGKKSKGLAWFIHEWELLFELSEEVRD